MSRDELPTYRQCYEKEGETTEMLIFLYMLVLTMALRRKSLMQLRRVA